MSTPADVRVFCWIVFRIIIFWDVDGESFVYIPVVLTLERERIVFGMTGHKDMAPVLGTGNIYPGFLRLSQHLNVIHLFNICAADLRVAGVRSEKNIIESAQQAFG